MTRTFRTDTEDSMEITVTVNLIDEEVGSVMSKTETLSTDEVSRVERTPLVTNDVTLDFGEVHGLVASTVVEYGEEEIPTEFNHGPLKCNGEILQILPGDLEFPLPEEYNDD